MTAPSVRSLAWHAMALDQIAAVEVRQAVVQARKLVVLGSMLREGLVVLSPGSAGVPDRILDSFQAAADQESGDGVFSRDELDELVVSFVTETAFCRVVDSFLTYLREILYEIAQVRPEVLKSSEKITYTEVLDQPSLAGLVAHLAETKVERLSREGYQSLVDFIKRHIGENVFSDEGQERKLGLFVDVRNLHVHHRGLVHQRFARVWGEGRAGCRYAIGWPFLIEAMRELRAVATSIDRVAVEEFGVPSGGVEATRTGE